MNPLEELHKQIDKSDWDVKQTDDINRAFKEVNEKLKSTGSESLLEQSDLEREAFSFNKSPNKGLSCKLSGDKTLPDGSIVPFQWPDINEWDTSDIEYIKSRFKQATNLFAKSEYGLIAFYKNRLNREESSELLSALTQLATNYLDKAKRNNDEFHYIFPFRTSLKNAFHIAFYRKYSEQVKSLCEYIIKVHSNWDLDNKSTLRVIIDLTDFAIRYYKEFIKYVDVKIIIDRNWEAANFLINKNDLWGGIYTADISLKLSKLIGSDCNGFSIFKAQQYEKLAKEALDKKNLAAVSFIEYAMDIYRDMNDVSNYERLQQEYLKYRNHFELGKVELPFSQDESKQIHDYTKKLVNDYTEEEIVAMLLFTPMLRPLTEIQKMSDELAGESVLVNQLPTGVQDKFGNTIAMYSKDAERKEFAFLRIYSLHFQIASQSLLQFILEAHKANKLSYNSVLDVLKKTWLNEPAERKSYGKTTTIDYLAMVAPGIKLFFDELETWKQNPSTYVPNFICSTDSLIIKIEYLLREICNKMNIATFKSKRDKPGIIMESILDDLLDGLEPYLTADDLFFIKYVLNEKAGLNLRNRIAHGLIDNNEYSIMHPIYAICIILKLSNYRFTIKTDKNG